MDPDEFNINLADLIGQKVYLNHEDGKEYGVIVNAWIDSYLGAIDCHIAFYPNGDSYDCNHKGEPEKPYVLRYLYSSLNKEFNVN